MFPAVQILFDTVIMAGQKTTLWAPVKWAQRKDSLYVTIDLPDVKHEKVSLQEDCLTFEGTSNDQDYKVDLHFFKPVDTSAKESKWAINDRNVAFFILKKNIDEEFWPRLLSDKVLEKTNVTTDWNKYVDEDEDEGEGFDTSALNGAGGFDMQQMLAQQAQGESGLPQGMDEEEDSDDDGTNELVIFYKIL